MTTVKCKDCGGIVSKRANQCPHCGAPVKQKKGMGCMGLIGLIVFILFVSVVVLFFVSLVLGIKNAGAKLEQGNLTQTKREYRKNPEKPINKQIPEKPINKKLQTRNPAKPIEPNWSDRFLELHSQYTKEFPALPIGKPIELKPKVGSTFKGILMSVTESEIQVKRGKAIFAFPKSDLSSESCGKYFSSNYARLKASSQVAREKDAFKEKKYKNSQDDSELEYSIIQDSNLNARRCVCVQINKIVSKDILKEIAIQIKKSDPNTYERTSILYRIPDMQPTGKTYWATACFKPNLIIEIFDHDTEKWLFFDERYPEPEKLK